MADWKEVKKEIDWLKEEYKKDNDRLLKENKELKEMLKTALTTVNSVCYCLSGNCNHCAYDCDKDKCDNNDGFKWVHEDKIKKLIGE